MVGYQHHEPIIEKEVFYQVQENRGRKRNPQYRATHPLVGKIVCGCCKKNLSWRGGLNPYFSCRNRYTNTLEKCVDRVNATFLEQYILYKMQEKLEAEGETEKLHTEMVLRLKNEIRELKAEREQLKTRMQKAKMQNLVAYEAYASGKSEGFQSHKIMVKSLEDEFARINEKIQKLEESCIEVENAQSSLWAGSQFAELSKEMIEHSIEKVVVYDEQHMEIFWKK